MTYFDYLVKDATDQTDLGNPPPTKALLKIVELAALQTPDILAALLKLIVLVAPQIKDTPEIVALATRWQNKRVDKNGCINWE